MKMRLPMAVVRFLLGLYFVPGFCFASAQLNHDSMSMDVSLIRLNVGPNEYTIPRNYIVAMSDWHGVNQKGGFSIRVTYPGLKPYSKETEKCMLRQVRCRIYNIYVTDTYFSSEKISESLIENQNIPKVKSAGPFGFTQYSIGPENARINLYERIENGSRIIFDCKLYDVDGRRGGVCHHFSHTRRGTTLSYFFEMTEGLSDAIQVDDSIKKLMDEFYTNGR